MIDAVSTMLNITSAVIYLRSDDDDDDDEKGAFGGRAGVVRNKRFAFWLAITGLVFIIGPLCGYAGAIKLRRGLVGIYLAFCFAKTGFEIALAILTLHLWLILIAFIQIWVTKIVYTFWRALGTIPRERCEQMSHPDFLANAPVRVLYW